MQEQEKKRADQGLAPKRGFNIAQKMKELKMRDEEKGEEKIIDPLTVKIRKFPNTVTEDDLRDMMLVYGKLSRVKIPVDEAGYNKGIGFVTFESKEVAS
jgi:RNA recognition motif-containing protein